MPTKHDAPASSPVCCRLPTETVVALDARAEAEGVKRADLLARGVDLVLGTDPAAPDDGASVGSQTVPPPIDHDEGFDLGDIPDREAWIENRARQLFNGHGLTRRVARNQAAAEYAGKYG
jgi:hypothetical protein